MSVSFSYIDSQSVQDALEEKFKISQAIYYWLCSRYTQLHTMYSKKRKRSDPISTDFDEVLRNIKRI